MEIRELRRDTITANDTAELARLRTLVDPRRYDGDPPVSEQLALDGLWPSVSTYSCVRWGLFEGDTMVCLGESAGSLNSENADVVEVGVWPDPAHDDPTGLRRTLFEHIVADETKRGRTRFEGWGDLSDAGTKSFWEDEVGYSLAYDERISRCLMAEIDTTMLQQWIDRATERASGYHLVRADAPFTDEQLGYYAQGLEAMNDAPHDDLVFEPETFDVARAREIQQLHTMSNAEYRAIFAIETATGALAGYTAVRVPLSEPAVSKQRDTVTIAAHRNQGIGRWIKADMIQWLLDVRPEIRSLDTGNAESNRAMLAINEALGFRDIMHHGVWHQAT